MADKKSSITPLNLQGNINLEKMASELQNYGSEVFNSKNALFYNNVVTNWYRSQLANDCTRMYKGKKVKVHGSYVEYGGKEYSFTGGFYKLTKLTDYTPADSLVTIESGEVLIKGHSVGKAPAYYGYPSVKKVTDKKYLISIIPKAVASVMDCVTYEVDVSNSVDYGITNVTTHEGCIVHAESGYGVKASSIKATTPKFTFGKLASGTTFDSLWTGLETVDIHVKEGTYYPSLHDEGQDIGWFIGDFSVVGTKDYIQCTFNDYIAESSGHKCVVVYTGFFGDGFRYSNWVNTQTKTSSLFAIDSVKYNGYRRDILLSTDGKKFWWNGGIKVPLVSSNDEYIFDVLYNYGGIIEGISYKNSLIVRDIDEIVEKGVNIKSNGVIESAYVIYKFKNKYYKLERTMTSLGMPYYFCKNLVCFNTENYLNTLNLDTGEMFCRSDDYNNRAFIVCHNPWMSAYNSSSSEAYQVSNYYYLADETKVGDGIDAHTHYKLDTSKTVSFLYGSAVNESYYADNLMNPSTIEAPINLTASFSEDKFLSEITKCYPIDVFYDTDIKTRNINVYLPNTYGGVPVYLTSLGHGTINSSLEPGVTAYPMNTDSNTMYNITVTDELIDTLMNQVVVKTPNYNSFTILDNKMGMVLGYYLMSLIEFNDVFIIQNQWYATTDTYIIRLDITNGAITGTSIAAIKNDMKFLGNTSTEAYFYSSFDRSIYTFAGDYSLSKYLEATAISDIYKTFNNPSLSLIALATNLGMLVSYQGQICLIEDDKDADDIYFDDGMICCGKYRYSFNPVENFEKVPVILETELLGEGAETKSVNDCVYIRLYTEETEPNGKLIVTSRTLNDRSFESEKKVFNIDKSKIDKGTGQCYIRYQPKFQSAVGFSVRIESDFPVISVAIGHKPETVSSSVHNL